MRRCCRASLKHGGLPNTMCIGHRTSKSGYMIKVQLSHHFELVTKCSCMNQQPTLPRFTSLQDHRVGHITLCLCENRAGVRLVVKIQKASIKLALKRLHQFPAKVAGHSKRPVNSFVAQANPVLPMGTLYLNWTQWRQQHGLMGPPDTRTRDVQHS